MANQNKMLEGWYCRTLANEQAAASSQPADSDEDSQYQDAPGNQNTDYKSQYKYLKKKLKFLIYENEAFQDALRSSQRRLLKVSRDRSFLLDRLLQYEKPSSSETDETESSADENRNEPKKRKTDLSVSGSTNSVRGRKRKNMQPRTPRLQDNTVQNHNNPNNAKMVEGHMTAEEVERHLQSRQSITELVPERAPATVPNEMFSNEPSLDSESNDQMVETSPSIICED